MYDFGDENRGGEGDPDDQIYDFGEEGYW
jgi:hypothetical protein